MFLFALLGGLSARVSGGWIKLGSSVLADAAHGVLSGLFALLVMFYANVIAGTADYSMAAGLLGAAMVALVTFGTATPAHGMGIDMGRNAQGYLEEQEWLKRIVDRFFGKETEDTPFNRRWLRDATGLAISGMFIFLGLEAALWVAELSAGLQTFAASWLLLFGLAKPVAYEIGWQSERFTALKERVLPAGFRGPTEIAEFLFGVAYWYALYFVLS
jgi:hypothetical protein